MNNPFAEQNKQRGIKQKNMLRKKMTFQGLWLQEPGHSAKTFQPKSATYRASILARGGVE